MTKTNKKALEEIIRVDHAGERGAIKIYEGQLLALKTFKQNEPLKRKIEEFCKYCDSPDQVIFHGGGTKNLFLMKIIQSKIDTKIRTTDDEISSKFVEAAAFAYLAYKNQGIIFKPKL